MVSEEGAGANLCVSADKGRKQAERWQQCVTPGPQAWAATAVVTRITAPFVLYVRSRGKKGFQSLLLLFAQCWPPRTPLKGPVEALHCLIPSRPAEMGSLSGVLDFLWVLGRLGEGSVNVGSFVSHPGGNQDLETLN
jgi:hypothetical protein